MQIRNLLKENPESPLAQLLREAQAAHSAGGVNMQHPAAAMQALVGLLRSKTRDAMQLSILQLHQSIATHVAQPTLPVPAAPSPMLMSPSALSALLTPSGSGFRVDFGAALKAIEGGTFGPLDPPNLDPLDVSLSPLPSPPPDTTTKVSSSGKRAAPSMPPPDSGMMPPPKRAARLSREPSIDTSRLSVDVGPGSVVGAPLSSSSKRSSRPAGLNMPSGIGMLSVEVTADTALDTNGGALSISSLSNAPLSAILGAFGFGSAGGSSALPLPPSAGGTGFTASLASPALNLQPLSAQCGGNSSHMPIFGLNPLSMQNFVGLASAQLLEDALEAPLSTHLSHSRKSPRLFPGEHDFKNDFMQQA